MVSYVPNGEAPILVGVVLILIVVDNGFVRYQRSSLTKWLLGLNPYCSGQWFRTQNKIFYVEPFKCLNPYCSGQWFRTNARKRMVTLNVLILIVVDNGFVPEIPTY